MDKIEELKIKALKAFEGYTVQEIQTVAHYIFANIDSLAIYKPKEVKTIKVLEEPIKEHKDLLQFPDYPINGVWTEKLKFLFTKVLNKEKIYTTKEIIGQFCLIENKKYNEISQKVYSVLNYCTLKYPQFYIEETTGNKINKKFRFKKLPLSANT